MTKKQQPRKPRVVKLERELSNQKPSTTGGTKNTKARKPRAQLDLSRITQQDTLELEATLDALEPPKPTRKSSGFTWVKLFFATFAGLLSLGAGLAIDQLIQDLFARHDWLGWAAAGLTVLFALAVFVLALREIWGISRLNTIEKLRAKATRIQSGENPSEGKNVAMNIMALYSNRPDMAGSKTAFERSATDILDGQDLLAIFETAYLGPIDNKAKKLVMQSAKRVSVVTAISPRAIVDILYVLIENIRLIKQISYLYGARPGVLGFWKLARNVIGHLAVTGVIAAGDSLIQQFVGHGLAARLSSKLGEGVVNGLLTARIGIAAMDQARPMEFRELKRPGVSEYFSALSRSFKD